MDRTDMEDQDLYTQSLITLPMLFVHHHEKAH